jgi:hypothetical protein
VCVGGACVCVGGGASKHVKVCVCVYLCVFVCWYVCVVCVCVCAHADKQTDTE